MKPESTIWVKHPYLWTENGVLPRALSLPNLRGEFIIQYLNDDDRGSDEDGDCSANQVAAFTIMASLPMTILK